MYASLVTAPRVYQVAVTWMTSQACPSYREGTEILTLMLLNPEFMHG